MEESVKKDTFTKEQRAAIDARGRTIVSASAGSGKTTVMIEKIIRLIQDGRGVDEILAVTFTKKAASQMKEKLRKAIVKTINDPATGTERKKELRKQLDLVPTADISTIHSFCAKLIRSHFYAAGVDNGFRVIGGDDADGIALKNAALDELLEEGYESKDERFLHLLSVYWRKKSDNALRRIFLTVYKDLRDRADYREYLARSGEYDEETFRRICADLHKIVTDKCRYYLETVEDERAYFSEVGGEKQLLLCDDIETALNAVLSTRDYFEACALPKPSFTKKSSSKKDPEEKLRHIERLASLKDKVAKIYEKEFSVTGTREEELALFLRSGKTAAALAHYLLIFDEKYESLKTERGVLDYNDLEHKALRLLQNAEIASEVREKYRFVFVDEYQDVNPVQEAIVSMIGGENLFLVGDVKQSIYGFRGSKSKFFVEKQKQFEREGGNSLVMKSNFRSSDAVLDAVNEQFSLAMNMHTCGINYARDAWMQRGGRYALNDGKTQIHFLVEEEKTKTETRGVYSVRAHASAKNTAVSASAKLIKKIIDEERNSTWYDPDEQTRKRVEYSDIAILSRKKQGQIAQTVEALAAAGVPVTAAAAVNICDFSEIKTLIDILSLLDNAEQDIPLCSALLSSMGELTADDLVRIRLAYPKERFFRNACRRYEAEYKDALAKKLKDFYAYFEELRKLSFVLDAGEILTKIIAETHMEARLLSSTNGTACLRRIHRFIEESAAPAPQCIRSFLERLRDLDYKIEYSENGGENSVKVLTMHSSKGLEYPVVILDNLSEHFRGGDHDEVFAEEEYGLAPRAFDEENMIKKNTLLRRLYDYKKAESSIADELNLYYVALTRAKYSLHMIFEKEGVLPDVRYARSFVDFTDFGVWKKYFVEDELFDVPKQERTALAFNPNETLAREIMDAFLWEYPYAGCENLPVKSSATSLLAREENTQTAGAGTPSTLEMTGVYSVKEEIEADGETSVEYGLAYHAFLERFDFSLLFAQDGTPISKEVLGVRVAQAYVEMEENGSVEGLDLVSVEKMTEILSNQAFYALQGMTLYKERQFLVSLPVKDTFAKKEGADGRLKNLEGEEMLFQGAIDLLAVGQDCVKIVDYKYSKKDAKYLREHYSPQLELYKLAVSKIMKIPKKKISCTIVNIYLGFQVDMD